MTEIRFYHLLTQTSEQALPQILQKALAAGHRIVVHGGSEAYIDRLNESLWTFRADSFLPHGTKKDGHAADQPIYLTGEDENPNNADVLILTGGAVSAHMDAYGLCCEIFDGRDEGAVQAARAKWTSCKGAGHDVTYWQQNENGGWDKKA